ncbi:hypothetical protein [Actinomadura kijaniata]|uniref:hypothetical protein n=1 Tax=Actinomadura kijaniata TaxID=46161 RepID=UPI00082DF9AF|nr:hypothetical protein [Actinomadura kijaniata]
MPAAEKRLPGQSNAEYERRHNPNADFIGTQSLQGGGDPSFMIRGFRALLDRLGRRKARQKLFQPS